MKDLEPHLPSLVGRDAICLGRDENAATGASQGFMRTARRRTQRRLLLFLLLTIAVAGFARASAASRRELRVCADGNNLPFSNQAGAGFENKLAELLAHELGAQLTYTWAAQRRGFVRNTLDAGLCDVIMGMPTLAQSVATTHPYYRSSYVLVLGPASPRVDSLDAVELRQL